jgi:hypothetical protein
MKKMSYVQFFPGYNKNICHGDCERREQAGKSE